ncbi:extracellular solute-binding protein [Paenibacillus sp. IB182496]|uniref:Extracellular solute-binding protein n=1 Tax=Paenibacillus sabuli TaxID=2772509 RepID=A0A927BY49_9BACL|nr:extracellular solute-binding protein [Paenibacillus sabuli]MBD2848046.1 extracellular solute-binding protein [Paenibacillus sabuli]
MKQLGKSGKAAAQLLLLTALTVTAAACSGGDAPGASKPERTPGMTESAGSGNSGADTGSADAGNTDDGEDAGQRLLPGEKFDPAITMTTARWVSGSFAFRDGEDIANNVHTDWMREEMGINLDTLWSVQEGDNYITKLRLALSAGEPLPDVLVVGDMQLASELIDSGLVQPIGDVFDAHASDIVKAAYNRDPSIWYPVYKDGDYYGLPIIAAGDHNDNVLYIRNDWLDAVGLDAPSTIAEMETVMEAFKTQDPDGNGKDDTYGFSFSLGSNVGRGDANMIYGAFGAIPGIWMKQDDGSLVYGSTLPEIKPALAKLKEWKEKGYLHPESGIYDRQKTYELFNSGRAGMIAGEVWLPVYPLPNLAQNVPGAEYDVIPAPTGPDGSAARWGKPFNAGVVLVNKDFEHPEALILYLNNLFEYWNADNPKYENGYFQGYDYDIIDGKVVNGSDIPGGQISVHHYFLYNSQRPIAPYQYQDTLTALYEGKAPETAFERYSYSLGEMYLKAGAVAKSQRDINVYDYGIGLTDTMKTRWDRLQQMESETFVKIIYGELPLDEFDRFVEKWKAEGGDKITQEMNDWYDEVNS